MATNWSHRVLILIPVARRAAMITWWNANMDAGEGANTWTVGLNASGNPANPITHYWVSTAMVPADLARLLNRLCTLAGLIAPDWPNLTRPELLDWLTLNLPIIRATTGIAVVRDDGDGEWSRAETLLENLGLQRLTAALS
jgi:hypothetical protein